MKTYLVADGGGTKTDFLLFGNGGGLAACRTAGANALFIDEAVAAGRVEQGIRHCLAQAGLPAEAPVEMVLFIPGFDLALARLRESLCWPGIELMNDAVNAFYGALSAPCGVVAMGGTGSFAMACDAAGACATVGGWGPMIGDAGGGYHIGVACLAQLARRYDARQPPTLLDKLAMAHLGIEDPSQLSLALYRPPIPRERVAALCPVAEQAARQGDAGAVEIIAEAGRLLAREAALAAARVDAAGLAVTLTGGVAKMGELIAAPFAQEAARLLPGCHYQPARFGPLVGGALYLLHQREQVDITTGALGQKLEESYHALAKTIREEPLC